MGDGIYESVRKARCQDEEALLLLINMYDPLLKKYAYLCKYEDAYNDLQLFFIDLILHKINLENLNSTDDRVFSVYFKRAVHNEYILQSKRNSNYRRSGVLGTDDEYDLVTVVLDESGGYEDDLSSLAFDELKDILNEKEYALISSLYNDGLSIVEIAEKQKVSRQHINQMKSRALSKVSKYYGLEENVDAGK